MVLSTANMSGLEKASILLVSLGSAASAEVLKHLSPAERELLGAQIVKMSPVQDVIKQHVLDEVCEMVKRPDSRGIEIDGLGDTSAPLKWLEKINPEEVADMLSKERPHSIALVIAHLAPGAAANVLAYLGDKTRNMVLHRLAEMGPVSAEAVKAVDEVLRERIRDKVDSGEPRSQASQALLKAFGDVTAKARESMLGAISRKEEPPAVLRREPASAEDLALLSDSEIRMVLHEADMEDVSLTLGVATQSLRDAVLRNLPEEISSVMRASFEGQIQIKVRDIEAAQGRIVDVLRKLTKEGRIGGVMVAAEAAA